MEVEVELEHLFRLKDCSNLSELTLDMSRSESCAIRDSIYILSTLDPARIGHLEAITLETRYASRWFNKDGSIYVGVKDESEGGGDEEEDNDGEKDKGANWEWLDAVLSKLADASTSTRGKRLMFTLVVFGRQDVDWLMHMVRKWLPQLLPRFNELGLLRVHRG